MSQIQSIYAPKTEEQLKKVYAELEKHQKKILELSNMSIDFYGGKSASNPNELKTAITTIDQLNAKIKEQDVLLKKLQATQGKVNKTEKQIIAQKQKQLALNARNAATNAKLSSSWNQLNQKLKTAELNYKNLAASLGTSNARTISAQKETLRLRAQVDKINVSVKRFNGNVGNYKSALGGALPVLRSFIGAFGLTSGVYLFAGAIKDAFDRIREFDKSMQNIAGIMRTTRSEISDLEDEIIKVAGSSIKTSREVAGLAESLVTLGKTKSEIIDLLEPVNNLAIGLETTSEEAAEFLVQTMNAFGASSDEAAQYADTIATIRTSTTLDFQKMRDSFQYLTPISRVLNKDLAYTGSVLGILADNGLKAEAAGRLLGTAQQKLAKEGRSLQDALDEINKAVSEGVKEVELLEIASDLFGKQAAKVGIILAQNTDVIETNAQAIRDNGGALEDLTNKQLESLDAKLKILDSTWEKLLLSFEKGDGIISDILKGGVELLTGAIDNLSNAVSVLNGEMSKELAGAKLVKGVESLIPNVFGLRDAMVAAADSTIELDEVTTKYVKSIQMQNEAYVKAHGSLAPLTEEQLKMNDAMEDYLKYVKGGETNSGNFGTVEYYQKLISENQKLIKEQKTINDLQDVRKIQAQNAEYQRQIDLILNNTKATKSASREKVNTINSEINSTENLKKSLEAQIETFKKIRDMYALNSDEANYYTERINQLNIALGKTSAIDVSSAMAEIQASIDSESLDPPKDMESNWKDTFTNIANIASQAIGIIDELNQRAFDAQNARLESQYETAIELAGDNVAAQEEIERQYTERKNALAAKQAAAEKRTAIFESLINTASAVVQALPNVALSIIVGAMGAAQTAMIASTPIPAYEFGGYHSGGTMLVNDAKGSNYKEIVETPDGKLSAPQGRNVLMNAPKGTFIHKSYDDFMSSLDMELLNNDIAPIGGKNIINLVNKGLTRGEVMEVMNSHADRLINTITSQHGVNINIDENGLHKYSVKQGKKSKILNARYRGKGFSV